MPQPILRRIALRAVQLAIVAAGIFVLMLLFSRQAHAATSDSSPASPPAPVTSAVGSVASPVTSTASRATSGATAAAPSPAHSTATADGAPNATVTHAPA